MSFAWNVITISVPNVTGMTAARAASALRAVGLGLPLQHNVVDLNCDKPVGTVISQSPSAGAQVGSGYAVHIAVEEWPTGRRVCN